MTNNLFQLKTYSYNNILDIELLFKSLDLFIMELKHDKTSYINLLIKINGIEEDSNIELTYSLFNRTPLDLNNLEDINKYKHKLVQYCNTLSDHYKDIFIHNLIFNYIILNEVQYNQHKGYSLKLNEDVMNLPKTILDKNLKHSLLPVEPSDQFNDVQLSDDSFKRTLDNKTLFYKNGKIELLLKQVNNLKFMKTLKPNKYISKNLMCLDIETFVSTNPKVGISTHIPYCISLYLESKKDEVISKSFISSGSINNVVNNEDLFNDLFDYLFQPCFHNYIIYIHNSSSFDMIFLFKLLLKYKNINKIKPIIKDSKFINLEIYFKVDGKDKIFKVSFRDSYLLLPNSLSNLAKAFKVEDKGIFPYSFVNDFNLNYDGKVPDYVYFDTNKVSLEDYLNYNVFFSLYNKYWNLLDESKKYCELDCKSLFNFFKELR